MGSMSCGAGRRVEVRSGAREAACEHRAQHVGLFGLRLVLLTLREAGVCACGE